jgi:PIN domain nuclease of toxin-antitoxin system
VPAPPSEYASDRRHRLGISALALEEPDVLQIEKLPPLHRDPFDRMLVSQAIARGLTLATPDPSVRAYPCVTWWG